jgi:hypothetical protein
LSFIEDAAENSHFKLGEGTPLLLPTVVLATSEKYSE